MISSKLLVFRGPRGVLVTEPVEENQTRRRKKSCGDLFQNGYRVRFSTSQPGYGRQKNKQNSFYSCLRVLSNWCKWLFLGIVIFLNHVCRKVVVFVFTFWLCVQEVLYGFEVFLFLVAENNSHRSLTVKMICAQRRCKSARTKGTFLNHLCENAAWAKLRRWGVCVFE